MKTWLNLVTLASCLIFSILIHRSDSSSRVCSPVAYHFCDFQSLNESFYTLTSINKDSDFLRSLDDHTLEANILYEFIPQKNHSLCFMRWKKLICSSWFPKCDGDSGTTSQVCRETCDDLMLECPPDVAMEELFTEKNTLYNLLLKYVQTFKANALKDCEIFPSKASDSNCSPYRELITKPKSELKRLKLKNSNWNSATFPDANGSLTCSFDRNSDNDTTQNYTLIRYWVFCWALVCFLSSTFTFATFLIDSKRFKYPEKATVFISLCYIMIALVYITGFFAKTSMACSDSIEGTSISHGLKNFGCVLSFAVQYYFMMSLSIWWVIFGLTWFLAAGLKWCQDIMDKTLWFMFHGVAWLVPGVKTIFIIASKEIDGDIFTGTCFTGYTNPVFLWSLVIAPFAIYLVTGFVLLLTGFISLYLIRKEIRKEPNMSEKAERVIFRVVMFVLIYVMAAAILVSVFLYEDSVRPESCSTTTTDPSPPGDRRPPPPDSKCFYPSITALIIKYFMLFIPGTLAGFWLWTPKTFNTWKRFLNCSDEQVRIQKRKKLATESKIIRVHISASSPVDQGRPLTDLERAILAHPANQRQFSQTRLLNENFSEVGSFV